MHSATKFLAGHSDVLLGARASPATTSCTTCSRAGATCSARSPGTFEAWLALRGLRTLHLRLERAAGQRRRAGPPAAASTRRSARCATPASARSSSIVLAERREAADLLTHTTSLWVHATSLGGVESTFERRRRWKTEPADDPRRAWSGSSVGIEDVEDLWDDLAQALDSSPDA